MSILVYTENSEGKFKKSSFELLSYGSEIAKMMSVEMVAVTIGNVSDDELKTLGKYGADKVLRINDSQLESFTAKSYTRAISSAVEEVGAKVVVFSNNSSGIAIAPRMAVKLNASIAPGVMFLPQSVNPFVVKKRVYSGKAFADYELSGDIKILTLNQNSFQIIENQKDAVIEDLNVNIQNSDLQGLPKGVEKTKGKVLITEAEILVSGGRGLKGPENWGMIEEMADILGAATCCSRPVADLEWRPHYEHVGQTGKLVAPNLYIAIGISGAIQHLAGVNGSKVLVAINIDPEAPFFEAADYGIVGDAFEVVPKLNEAFRKLKKG